MSYAEGDAQRIDQILNDLRDPQLQNTRTLGEVLRLELSDRWEEAAGLARPVAHLSYAYSTLLGHRVLSLLCSGNVAEAAEAGRLVEVMTVRAERLRSWLLALIAIQQNDQLSAQSFLSQYLDRPLTEEESRDELFWLRLWDRLPDEFEPSPAFYFPRLPPALTGIRRTLIRRQFGPSVLSEHLDME